MLSQKNFPLQFFHHPLKSKYVTGFEPFLQATSGHSDNRQKMFHPFDLYIAKKSWKSSKCLSSDMESNLKRLKSQAFSKKRGVQLEKNLIKLTEIAVFFLLFIIL